MNNRPAYVVLTIHTRTDTGLVGYKQSKDISTAIYICKKEHNELFKIVYTLFFIQEHYLKLAIQKRNIDCQVQE